MCFREGGGGSAEYSQRPYFDHFIFQDPSLSWEGWLLLYTTKHPYLTSQTQSNYFRGGGGGGVKLLCLIGCILGRKGFVLDWARPGGHI